MKYIALILTAFVITIAWAAITRLDSQALSLMVAMLLGVCSGIPTALVVLAAGRQRETEYQRGLMQAPAVRPWWEYQPATISDNTAEVVSVASQWETGMAGDAVSITTGSTFSGGAS